MRIGTRIRLAMLRAASVLAAGVLASVIIVGRSDSHAGEGPPPTDMAAAPADNVTALYERRCARCHDADGTGTALRSSLRRLPDFTNARWQQQRSDPQLVVSILEGKGTQMPAFAGRLSRKEARALVRHVRGFASQEIVGVQQYGAVEFSERFRALQQEFERLRKQFHDLNGANK